MGGDARWRRLGATWLYPAVVTIAALAGCSSSITVPLSVTPGAITIHPGDQNVPVSVGAGNASGTAPIEISVSGLPSGIVASALTLTPGGSGTLTLSAAVSADQEAFPPSQLKIPNSHTQTVTIVGQQGSTKLSGALELTVSLSNPAFQPAPSNINLPIISIDTGGQAIGDVAGTVTITSADRQTTYLPNHSDTDNTATFKVHGHTTAEMPKLAYEMKLNTSLDLLATMGLSCPYVTSAGKSTCDKSKTYVLLANYDDKTFLRNWAALALANAIPIGGAYLNSPANSPSPSGTNALMPWASHSLFVELYLNGEYEGNYEITEKVNVDSHRINIQELSESDTTGDLSGGYFLQIDHHKDEAFVFTTPRGLPIGLEDPDFSPDPEVPAQTSYIMTYVDAAEDALFSSQFSDPAAGWRKYFDLASAVNFYIVNEVMGNQDSGTFYSSVYLYKDKDNPLLYMGPVWDFDVSAGNDNYSPILHPTVPWVQTQASWYAQWFKDPSFRAAVVAQWQALQNNGVFTAWLASIQQQAAQLQQSQANNFGRWPMQGIMVWPNAEAAGSYDGEVAYLIDWLTARIAYLDSTFNTN